MPGLSDPLPGLKPCGVHLDDGTICFHGYEPGQDHAPGSLHCFDDGRLIIIYGQARCPA